MVKGVREQIAANEKAKKDLETAYPNLVILKVSQTNSVTADPTTARRVDLVAEMSSVSALQARIKKLTDQLDHLRKEAAVMGKAEGNITELNRQMQIQAAQYEHFKKNLDLARMDEKLSASKVNISIIQAPSPPRRDNAKLHKLMVGFALGAVVLAFGLAFITELYLDQSLRRPRDVELKIGLPLFLTIPKLSLNGHAKALGGNKQLLLARDNGTESRPAERQANPLGINEQTGNASAHSAKGLPELELAPWDPKHLLRPFSEALRDRLITYFEVNHLTHKPKLVAVTSCGEGSGVSTVAAGLAASLSETGDGNVLLVDMNVGNGTTRQFYKGDLACGLEDVLAVEKRDHALVQDRLYFASESMENEQLPRALPNRFKHLVPRLKASDYDYIIFDMPPVSQISVTPRLAKFMDMVLMVAESEKTDYQVLRRANSLLTETKANVGIVLNKGRTYVPKRLQQEL
jgi:Mrp family chromosome partitioning ATPase